MEDLTRILHRAGEGDPRAAERLFAAVYEELRELAAKKLSREKPGGTLQATALVHEAFLRLFGGAPLRFENRAHFFGTAAEAMRRILVEAARRRARLKRGGGRKGRELAEGDAVTLETPEALLDLDAALGRLEEVYPVHEKLVKLRFFAGLTSAQAGEVLGLSRATADRYWAFARAWLYDAMKG